MVEKYLSLIEILAFYTRVADEISRNEIFFSCLTKQKNYVAEIAASFSSHFST
jgi:hypothetical protein